MFESAKWIAAPQTDQPSPLFRLEFPVKPGLTSASLSLCALGYGVATVNGQPVTEDVLTTPLTRFDATVQYNTYDVAPLLQVGDNALGVMLGNGWYNDTAATWDYEKAPWRHHPKLLAQLDLEADVRQVLNINVPARPWEEIQGVRWAPQGDCIWLGAYEERVSPSGRRYFWSTYGGYSQTEGDDDRSLLEKGYVTLTPLTYEMTDPAGFSGKECTL